VYAIVPDWSRISSLTSEVVVSNSTNGSVAIISNGDHSKGADNNNNKKRRTAPAPAAALDAIELLLQVVANHRKTQPQDEAQVSCLENACIILAAALTFSSANVHAFIQAQGVELVMRCLKERVHAGGLALKWLDFAGSESVHRQACEHLVEAGAFKYLFPLFMGRHGPKAAPVVVATNKNKFKKEWSHMLETTTIRILYDLTRHLQDDSPKDARQRLLAKFVEEEKCDRLVELCLRYDEKARQAEFRFFKTDVEEALDNEEMVQLAALEAKLAGGGEVLHRICAVAAFCCVGSKRCHERILSQLRLQQSGIGLIRDALQEFASNLGDGTQKEQLEFYLEHI
jgi:beta-catenin-like protein 1